LGNQQRPVWGWGTQGKKGQEERKLKDPKRSQRALKNVEITAHARKSCCQFVQRTHSENKANETAWGNPAMFFWVTSNTN